MQITLDLKNVQNLFAVVPEGLYKVRIEDFDDKESDKGPWCRVTFMIVDGEYAEQRAFSDNWHFGEKSLWRTKAKMEAFANQTLEDEEFNFDSNEWIGQEAYALTRLGTYTDKKTDKEVEQVEVVEFMAAPPASIPEV